MTKFTFKESDFDLRRDELVSFLKNQNQFRDFDYNGPNMSVLIDLLSYNSMMQSFQRNIEINERFSDSARLPRSVASHAKTFNYIPHSMSSSHAILDVELISDQTVPFIVIPNRLSFNSNTNRAVDTFTFWSEDNLIFTREDGKYRRRIDVYEGNYKTESFFVRNENDIYTLTRSDIDISSIEVYVQSPNHNATPYKRGGSLVDVTDDSNVFFVQTSDLERYEIYFGAGNFGTRPQPGSTIVVEYRYSNGPKANGVSEFISPRDDQVPDGGQIRIRSVIQNSSGGSDRESIESIKRNSAAAMKTMGRAVTEADYVQLLKDEFPFIQSIAAVGGETLTPPEYGKVVLIVDIAGMDGISETTSDQIKEFIEKKSLLTAKPIVRSPGFMYIDVVANIKITTINSTKTVGEIKSLVQEAVMDYSGSSLNDFNRTFRLSKMSNQIDLTEPSIISNITKVRPVIDWNIIEGKNAFKLNFNARLIPSADYSIRSISSLVSSHPAVPDPRASREETMPAIMSSSFIANGLDCYLVDDGYGQINTVRNFGEKNIIVEQSVGTVDYETGTVVISNLTSGEGRLVKIYANVSDSDISAPLGSIIKIRREDIKVNIEVDN